MGDLTSYELVHFLPFSREVFDRMFVRLNETYFPLPIVTALAALAAIWRVHVGDGRSAMLVTAAAWALCAALFFFIGPYADLLWAAPYFGGAFVVQALLLGGVGAKGGDVDDGRARGAAVVSATLGLIVFPLLPVLFGRDWSGVEIFGMAPTPTAIVTIGLLVAIRPFRAWLLVIPLLWLVVSAATHVALASL